MNVWIDCPGVAPIAEICENLEKVQLLTFYKWNTKNIVVCKISDEKSGEEAASKLVLLILREKLTLHRYIYCQYADLKWLKSNLKIDEAILSIDFSHNYDNKQRHEIQKAYFRHEFLPYLLLNAILIDQ